VIPLIILGIGATVAAAVYLMLSRDLLRAVVGLSLLGTAVNLVLLVTGRPHTGAPPVIPDGESVLASAANPLPQALVLTAIVIGFSLTCFSLILVLAIVQRTGSRDSHRLQVAEPPADADGEPAIEEPAKEDG
jgi:multicomponent Na+:H+ antiporter subunit C